MRFELTTRWQIPAPRERVFDEIAHPERWPGWWPGVVSTREDDSGDRNGIGRRGEIVWRAPLFRYKVRFEITATRVEPPVSLEADAVGDLRGTGTWQFRAADPGTDVEFAWRVEAVKPLLRVVSPVARLALVWGHDRLMRAGERGLTEHLSR